MSALNIAIDLARNAQAPGCDRTYVLRDLERGETAQQTYALNVLWALEADAALKSGATSPSLEQV